MRRRRWVSPAVLTAVLVATASVASAATLANKPLGENPVGRQADGSVLVPEDKYVTPAGATVEQTGQPIDMGVSPDGRTAVTLTKSGNGLFTVVDLVGQKVLQQVTPPRGTGSGDIGVGGVLWSKDGRSVYVTQSRDVLRFAVAADRTLTDPVVIPMPTTGVGTTPAAQDGTPASPLPTDLQWAPDGRHLLVVLDGFNTLGSIDTATNTVDAQVAVGIAPRDVAVIGTHAFVSNEGGRVPTVEDFTNLSYDSPVVADSETGRATTGTVSEVDLATRKVVHTYAVGLDPSSMVTHGTDLLVTNSNDDTVSILDTKAHTVAQTVNVNPLPGQPHGSSPNSLTFVDPTHLLVSLGRNNAVAIYAYTDARTPVAFAGLAPTGWYPGTVTWDAPLKKVVVANMKGVGALGADRTIDEGPGTKPATGHQVYADLGSVQTVAIPTPDQIKTYTRQVFANNQWNGLSERNPTGTGTAAPSAVPARIGDPSPIKHVFVIVRENRTYDQVLGDDPRGNGEPAFAQFGATVTPNSHALATRFPLIDNLYSNGTNSATGHTWLDAAFVNDYLERTYANYVRSYGQPDALVYPKSGFLWDNAMRHGLDARVWGEYAEYFTGPDGRQSQGTWAQWYKDSQILEGKATGQLHAPVGYFQTKADIPSLDRILSRDFPNFQTQIPDQYRADLFLRDLQQYEAKGSMPALNMLWVMNDHTAGTTPGQPTPAAMVADNDLATGRIIDAISHSSFWKDSAVFVLEDDSQNGIDHVDGHRNVALVASPYARAGAVVSTNYTQLNVTRTIEQILGLPPMNQLDLAAEPMRDVFTDTPDLRPFTALPNQIPLDTMNAAPSAATSPMAAAWAAWSAAQDFTTEDELPFAPFNRLTWYTSNGFTKPYPGDQAVLTPAQVEAQFGHEVVADPDDVTQGGSAAAAGDDD